MQTLRSVNRLLTFIAFLSFMPMASADPPKLLEKFENCTFVPTDWADGDSFLIRKPNGETMTVRLYGADCIEWHISDDADAQRLRTQRRYFGITEVKPSAKESIEMAKELGKTAADKTKNLLEHPFTIYTRMQKALGDGKHERFYAYIEYTNGSDLATELVRSGLARTHGVCADGPGERTRDDYRETLADIELQAAKLGRGIWAHTDWNKLPAERMEQRKDDEEDALAMGKAALPENFRLNPNNAARDELMKLPKIAETLADRIIEARDDMPFEKPEDLKRIRGIKDTTLNLIRPYLDFGKK